MLKLVFLSTIFSVELADIGFAQGFDSNDIIPSFVRRKEELPRCIGNSVCGFLQANDKGLTKLQYCECGGGLECPMQWDHFDGQSLSQAQADQYKYCGKAPVIAECSSGDQVAYTTTQKYHGEKQISLKDEIHCNCPFGSSYQNTDFDSQFEGVFEILKLSYFCMPLPTCNVTSICKDITESPDKYIVNPKCLCPQGQACPSVQPQHSSTIRMGESLLHQVQCERPLTFTKHPLPAFLNNRFAPRMFNSHNKDVWQSMENDAPMIKRSKGKKPRRIPRWQKVRWGPAIGLHGLW